MLSLLALAEIWARACVGVCVKVTFEGGGWAGGCCFFLEKKDIRLGRGLPDGRDGMVEGGGVEGSKAR